MLSKFFIERPIFANVIGYFTILIGLVALFRLPIEQLPAITPPTIKVTTNYPGASAQVVSDTVAAPIEQQVNGVERMLYMSSTCASDGSYALTVTFDVGTNLDMAQVLVQNRVSIALPQLPIDVQRQGVVTKKQSTSILLLTALNSDDGTYDTLYLANYATIRVKDELSRIVGVGDVVVIPASDYSMRIWLDPEKLEARSLTTQDVVAALQQQNIQVAAGQIGQPPAPPGQNYQYTITTLGRLESEAQFEDIIIKAASGGQGRITRLKDIARIELGGKSYDQYFQLNGKSAAALAIYQLPGSNALDVAEKVIAKMEELKKSFPLGVDYKIPFNTTRFVSASIDEVYHTLFEAGILVLIVIMVFLQDFRAVLIPATTVPVTIIGAFAAMSALGFSVNMLTLFGLVLAIGIVVDDAIVIVEGAAHNIGHDKMTPKDATIKAMSDLLGPIIGITLVLLAVFIPTAFLGGVTGQLYRQFALTIAATTIISAINAVTLKPAQCARYLRASREHKNAFFRGFNYVYAKCENAYVAVIRIVVRFGAISALFYLGMLVFAGWLFRTLPTGFLPVEDQGYFIVGIQLPDGASQERTNEVVKKINAILSKTPGVANVNTIGGQSLFDGTVSSNAAVFYVAMTEWKERKDPSLDQTAILANVRKQFGTIKESIAFAFPPPAIQGLGATGGFQLQIQDRGGAGIEALQESLNDVLDEGRKQPDLSALNSTFRANVPQIFADIDRVKVESLGIPLSVVFGTLQAYMGAAYVNDFNKFGRTYQVRVSADSKFRTKPEDIKRLRVRNDAGKMVPLGTVVNVIETVGPQVITRYNLYTSAAINGEAAKGFSSGDALAKMEGLAGQALPPSMGYEWTGMAYQEKKVGGEALMIFALAVLLVFMVLAAQYESWTSPAAIICVVPLGLLGAAVAVWIRGMDNNVYTQIGLVLIIALASKNAILIVEVARELRKEGKGITEAAIEASRRRFRPILMTSFAFILGVYPLTIANGAGAASRRALGTAVFGGMIASTVLAVGFVPLFYVVWQNLSEWRRKPVPETKTVLSIAGD
jgi:HAE1 family hydrophobic/amphiphilic exporter-1